MNFKNILLFVLFAIGFVGIIVKAEFEVTLSQKQKAMVKKMELEALKAKLDGLTAARDYYSLINDDMEDLCIGISKRSSLSQDSIESCFYSKMFFAKMLELDTEIDKLRKEIGLPVRFEEQEESE